VYQFFESFLDDGISIPSSYTSSLGPIQFYEVRSCHERDKPYFTSFEMSYVVHFRNRTELADPQALFTFTHPNRGECLKLILLSRRIWTNIWHEFDRNSDWQQPLWSSKISYQMRFDASRFRWLFRLLNARCQSLIASVFRKWLFKDLYFMVIKVNVIYFSRVSTYLTINYVIIYLWLYFA
jgi:hypothetical protein